MSGLTSYGAFVNLGGADGLIHISELSWDRITSVSDVLNVGAYELRVEEMAGMRIARLKLTKRDDQVIGTE